MIQNEKRTKIKQYWNERAEQLSNAMAATTNDIYLRELEISTIIAAISDLNLLEGSRILDIGCGDGYSTIKVAEAFPAFQFLGVDYSENMIKAALKHLGSISELLSKLAFKVGDVMDLGKACNKDLFDVTMTDRCLINLESFESQSEAIAQIAAHTKKGGYFIAIENFIETQINMNEARKEMGLPEISVRWHNLFFKEREFINAAEKHFTNVSIKDFSSSYYFATRVIYSEMCRMQGVEPDYKHEIHQLAVRLPWVGQFSPIRMAIMKKR
jgi:ubiquinone/menaquinone biosynthesis C-methylase UbiE